MSEPRDIEINLIDLAYCLRKKWKWILSMCVVGAVTAALLCCYVVVPKYTATAIIYIPGSRAPSVTLADLQLGQESMQDYMKVFRIWEVHEQVISNLELPYTCEQMQRMVSASNESNTHMIDIRITSVNPQEAALIANEYAAVVSQFIADAMSMEKPNIVSSASVPSTPDRPNLADHILLGFVLGGFLSGGSTVIRRLMTDTIRTAEDIFSVTGSPVLAVIAREAPPGRQIQGGAYENR